MRKTIFALLIAVTLTLCLSACGSIVPEEILGEYYAFIPKNGSYNLDNTTYFKLNMNRCDFNFPFWAQWGLVGGNEIDGSCSYLYGDDQLKLSTRLGQYIAVKVVDGVYLMRDYYFCKDGKAPYEVVDGVKYAPYSKELSAVLGSDQKEVTVKSSYNGLPTTILDNAFYDSKLESVTIENGVKEVGKGAFAGNANLKKVIIEGVTTIKSTAFSNCSQLSEVSVAFDKCTSLETIKIPNTVKKIGFNVFFCCSSLSLIEYDGTIEQWNEIEKADNWAEECNAVIKCTDGNISL